MNTSTSACNDHGFGAEYASSCGGALVQHLQENAAGLRITP
ncbi:hypothetical protein [Corynebacterium sp. BF-R-2]|nr:hypothetical protein [Corynebacterium sp. BF-R-2]